MRIVRRAFPYPRILLVALAPLLVTCGARTELGVGGARDSGVDALAVHDAALSAPAGRLFVSTGMESTPETAYFDLPDLGAQPLLPAAPSTSYVDAIVRVADRLYVADGANGIVWFQNLAGALDGPHALWDHEVTALAYGEQTHTLYALSFIDTATPSHVFRFDAADVAAPMTAPAASFDLTVRSAPFAADNGDRLYFSGGQGHFTVVEHASTLVGKASPASYVLDTPFTSSYPEPIAVDATRLWIGGADVQGVRLVIGYDLATLGPNAAPVVTLQGQLPAGEYVGALEARGDILAVAVDPGVGGTPPGPPAHVALFTGAATIQSDATPSSVLDYPSETDGWCGYAITVVRFVAKDALLFAGGWGYLAVDENPLGSATRITLDSCDPHDATHSKAPPVYLGLEPVFP